MLSKLQPMNSLEKRSKQVVYAVAVSFIIFLMVSMVLIISFIVTFSNLSTSGILQFILGISLSFAFTIYLGYVMRKIYKNRFK